MAIQINQDTTLCMSLAARPGNFGTRFHNSMTWYLPCAAAAAWPRPWPAR
jgi:hypothetical protein